MNIKYKALILFLTIPFLLHSQYRDIKYERISLEHGLPHSKVNCIIQDQQGFMWFGTGSGLCRYDGFKFKVYKNNKNDKKSLIRNNINCLYIDRYGILWIGAGELHKYNQESDDFTRYVHDKHWGSQVNDIKEDRFGTLWLSVDGNQLVRFDRMKEQFSAVLFSMKKDTIDRKFQTKSILISQDDVLWIATTRGFYKHKLPLPVNKKNITGHAERIMFIECFWDKVNRKSFGWTDNLHEDSKNNIWFIPARAYLTRYDTRENNFKHHPADKKNKYSIGSKTINFINEDGEGRIIVGTPRGCSIFDQKLKKYVDKYLIDSNLRSYFRDRTGLTWFGTGYEGILKISNQIKQFQPIWKYSTDAILEDNDRNLWLGGGSGLHKMNRITGESTLYRIEKSIPEYQNKNHILSLCAGKNNQLWIGAEYGLFIFDIAKQSFSLPVFSSQLYKAAGKNEWHMVFVDKNGLIWLANNRAKGLFQYDPYNNILNCFSYDPNDETSISDNYITRIYQDSVGNIWIGTKYDLNKFDKSTKTFKRFYLTTPSDIIEQQNNPDGSLWISTKTGLYQFDCESGEFTNCRLADGQVVNNDVSGYFRRIAEDNAGNIWFSSHNGLGKYNTAHRTLIKYYASDGLQGNTFFPNSHFKSKSGELFFGGDNGVSAFFPYRIKDDPNIPEIVITGFKKFNKPVKLDSNKTNLKQIILTHGENVFSFEYAALNFINPRKNQFAHKMEGFDTDWIYTGNKHDVTYTNLNPGGYTFRVKGSNSDGIWNEQGTSVRIIITPPWWQTNIAYILYVVLFGLIFLAAWRFQTIRLKMKHQLEIEHLHAEKLEEVDHLKSRFFADISHEFRTPLTLILGPVKQMLLGKFAGNVSEQYRMIIRNGERLLQLINQLLDLSKLESGYMALKVKNTDLIIFIKDLSLSFCSLAERKKITLKVEIKDKYITGYIDRDKVEKIVNNLLSNAFNFTTEGGEIILDCGVSNAECGIG
jgi:ligand-binding sensor domain-containing protein